MTGPAEGKLPLDDAKILLLTNLGLIKLNGKVYIHVKGYARARVTHLDIEHEILENIVSSKKGRFLTVRRVKSGIRIDLDKEKVVQVNNNKVMVYAIKVAHPYLSNVLDREGKMWIGGKFGGIYIGFRKDQIRRLEEIARKKFNFPI